MGKTKTRPENPGDPWVLVDPANKEYIRGKSRESVDVHYKPSD
jgi:hypothetical protein